MRFYTSAFARGDNVYVRFVEDGKRFQRKVKYAPYLFLPTDEPDAEYHTIYGKPVRKKDFDGMWEAKQFLKEFEDVEGFEVYGMDDFVYCFLNDAFQGEVVYDRNQLNIGTIDIEVESDDGFPDIRKAEKAVTAITLSIRGHCYSFGCGEFRTDNPNVTYWKYSDESTMLQSFLHFWEEQNLDVVTGWYIEFFDMPYLVNRLQRILGEDYAKKLSPWQTLFEREVVVNDRPVQVFTPAGIAVLDYMRLYKKFRLVPQESYTLNHVCQQEIGEGKLDYSEHDDLFSLYKHDFQKFMAYNIKDVVLVDKLDAKLGLLDLAFTLAYDSKINLDQVFGPVKMWDVIVHNYLIERNIVIPMFKKGDKFGEFEGAFVKEPLPGMHEWVASYDVNALYPSLIVQHNISPETFRGFYPRSFDEKTELLKGAHIKDEVLQARLRDENLSFCMNSTLWDRSKAGVFPELVEKFLADRKVFKNKMKEAERANAANPSRELEFAISRYHNLQNTKKVQLNSLYGALGNQYFRWYKLAFAEAITKTGRIVIQTVEQDVNTYLNKVLDTGNKDYVIAIDTDSNYIGLGGVFDKFVKPMGKVPMKTVIDTIDYFCSVRLEAQINKCFARVAVETNAMKPFLQMKREVIAERGVWTAKKKYVLNVWDQEGIRYDKPKLKVTGLELIKSSTPAICRERLKEAVSIIMSGTNKELIEHIDRFREEFRTLRLDEIGKPQGIHGMSQYTDARTMTPVKGCPMHVRGAIAFNRMLAEKGLEGKYHPIRDSDKIKVCYLREPNPLRENIISVLTVLPKEFGLDGYIDYDTQFEKSFVSPITLITNRIGWTTEVKASLDAFM